MTRADQRQVLEAFSRDYTRELHNLLAADLERFPEFVFQQLYNRLQWHVTEGEAAERITREAARRCAPGRPPWLHLRTRQRESEALIRTLAGPRRLRSRPAPSPPTGGASSRQAATRPSSSGTPRRARCEATLEGHGESVNACAFSPDGRRIVSAAAATGTLKLWDAETGACEATLEGHDGDVTACAFSPDGRRIVSASADKTLKLWDAETGACEATLEGHGDSVNACAFSPDGRRIVSGKLTTRPSSSGTRRRARARRPSRGTAARSAACAFSPDGRRIVSASDDKTLKLWDAETGACEATLEGRTADLSSLRLLTRRAAHRLGGAATRPSSSGTRRRAPARRPSRGTADAVTACAFSPDGRRIVSASGDKTLKLWDAETGADARRPSRGTTVRSGPAPSPPTGDASSRAVPTTPSSSGTPETGACQATLEGHSGAVTRLRLLTRRAAHRLGERRRDPQALGRRDGRLPGDPRGARRQGRRLRLLARRATRRLGELGQDPQALGRRDGRLPGDPRGARRLRSTPAPSRPTGGGSSRQAATAPSSSGTRRRAAARRPSRDTTARSACAFSPDGRRIVSGSDDATLKLWDAKTGSCRGDPAWAQRSRAPS